MSPSRALLVILSLSLVVGPGHSMRWFYNATRTLANFIQRASFLTFEDMSVEAIATRRGYPIETHKVYTEDGYILKLHRIPHGRNGSTQNSYPYPVIIHHGNFQTSADWLISEAEDSLGFFLADNGYDVYICNSRGNEYSIGHKFLQNHGSAFWNFSFHELGVHDLPAVLNYVTNITGKPKVHYISYSIGSTAFFAGMSKRAELSEKVAVGIAMGPSTFQTNFWHGWVQLFAPWVWVMQIFQKYAGEMPVLPHFVANLLHKFLPVICHPKLDVFGICLSVLQISMGQDHGKITRERLHTITKISPSSSSMKAFVHEMQLMGTGKFCEFDYGADQNMIVYGREDPPDYNLTNVRSPIALIVGLNDFIAHKDDAKTLASKLPNVVDFHYVPYEHFTHLDFCYGTGVGSLVYDHIVNLLHKYDNTYPATGFLYHHNLFSRFVAVDCRLSQSQWYKK